MTISHRWMQAYMAALTVVGLLHHTDHVLRYDHSGWPFRPEVTPFTFTLLVYPVIVSMFLIRNRTYRITVGAVLAVLVLGAHTFLETPHDQFATWAYDSSPFPHSLGHPNLLDVRSRSLGYLSVTIGMLLNAGVVLLPFLFWREER